MKLRATGNASTWTRTFRIVFALLLGLGVVARARAGEPDLKLEDVLARHRASIGSAEKLAALKSRAVEGRSTFDFKTGGTAHLDGIVGFYSEGRMLACAMQFASKEYPGERLIFNGNKYYVQPFRMQMRSRLGNFLQVHNSILSSGLLGGALSSAWPLLDGKDRQAKLKYDGLKKIAGVTLHQVSYEPKSAGALKIRLFFEPDTFRHVKTIYDYVVHAGASFDVAAKLEDTYYTLEEDFSDPQVFDGYTLPTRWTMHFNVRGTRVAGADKVTRSSRDLAESAPGGTPTVQGSATMLWDLKFNKVLHNVNLDPQTWVIP